MKYFIDGKEVDKNEFDNELETKVYEYIENTFDEFIDEIYPEVEVGNLSFSPSEVMKNCAPGDYDLWLGDEQDYRLGEHRDELERTGSVMVAGVRFEIEEEEN